MNVEKANSNIEIYKEIKKDFTMNIPKDNEAFKKFQIDF
jgi:formiminotetrahydrofolate cyclodeaminase